MWEQLSNEDEDLPLTDPKNSFPDWASDEVFERRFLRIVFDDKRQRQQKLQLIDQRMKELEEKEQQLETQ
jgi:hypothetical protein